MFWYFCEMDLERMKSVLTVYHPTGKCFVLPAEDKYTIRLSGDIEKFVVLFTRNVQSLFWAKISGSYPFCSLVTNGPEIFVG
jgi:hypothetical protein